MCTSGLRARQSQDVAAATTMPAAKNYVVAVDEHDDSDDHDERARRMLMMVMRVLMVMKTNTMV